ncbi:DUF1345 domain-containing protein [Hydrogenophaga sp. PAMC20947]|uniref:DUF1345 domain-containing protein n=1 Tax=Hydrogenophaga sp. PAMC20947 TaxID=2565558 RepID=UPI00109E2169|nr:DUF1345 domain-containing protein [Hydrogenophaga sp. PAMC20947]QCB47645.1 DUF1345 domain-containing protein [Hydrogenophaga sp. PAMC20947]
MKHLLHHFRTRPRLLGAMMIGLVLALLLPSRLPWVTRSLLGWNVAVWLYLLLMGWLMLRADHDKLHRDALAQAEDAATVLAVVVFAAVASLAGTVLELSAAKLPGAAHEWRHVMFAATTVLGGWLLLPTLFTLTYASAYYRPLHGGGLRFPDIDPAFRPSYTDFLYFSFTIAVASQTADIAVTSRPMRRLVLLQSLVSFGFNTAVLALTINIEASMF